MTKRLYFGDNLDVLRKEIKDESIDLIYLDPPFNSAANYNVLFRAPDGKSSESQLEAFEDTWHWGDSAEAAYSAMLTSEFTKASLVMRGIVTALGRNDMTAYLCMMAVRLVELHRVLKPTGSLYLHCDPTASHYLKVVMDGIFGATLFRNEVVWQRHNARSVKQSIWPRLHDVILHYGKSESPTFTQTLVKSGTISDPHDLVAGKNGLRYRTRDLTGAGTRKGETGQPWRGVDVTAKGRHWRMAHASLDKLAEEDRIYWQSSGMPRERDAEPYEASERMAVVGDVWTDIPPINAGAAERLGYPTQKPLVLLERIIAASSNPGDVVLDPFCGCGTAVHAAEKLGRDWVGIDVTHLAISLIERRMRDAFPNVKFDVLGTPKDIGAARDLASRDKHQFQWWAVSLVDAVPQGGKKKGADQGIDGIRWVRTGPREGDLDRVVVSVKGGENVSVRDVRDLAGTVQREGALGGLLITLASPTKPMMTEAASHGYASTGLGQFRKIMVKTVQELMAGVHDDAERLPPLGRQEGFRRAARERRATPEQTGLDL